MSMVVTCPHCHRQLEGVRLLDEERAAALEEAASVAKREAATWAKIEKLEEDGVNTGCGDCAFERKETATEIAEAILALKAPQD